MKGAGNMDDSFKKWLEEALAHYDKVVFLYHLSKELCIKLKMILKKEKRKFLLLTDMETWDFPCDRRKLCGEECRRLLELYFSYCFADNFILLTEQDEFPCPSIINFTEAGLLTGEEMLEAVLK